MPMSRRRLLECLAAGAARPLAAEARLQPWFPRAALGLFIHWGPCSVGQVEIGWSMFKNLNQTNVYWPVEKYNALADRFDPRNYDPDRWLAAAARAGFRYAVLTTKHCDGYTLWPSRYGDFGTRQKMHGRDLVRPYVEACRKNGLKVGFYFSPTDWNYCPKGWPYRGFPRLDRDFLWSDPRKRGLPKWIDMPLAELQKNYFERFYAHVKAQITELLTNYGRIDLLWWDGYDWRDDVDIHGREMQDYVRQLQPDIVLNDRYVTWSGTKTLGDYNTDLEAKDPSRRPPGAWEQCEQTCVGWSYRGVKAPCKPAAYLIERLARDRAWGGNYLPDFGPLPDGSMPPAYYEICGEMAEWMRHSAAAIYDVEAGPFPERADCPVTVRGGDWFLHFLTPNQRTARLKQAAAPRSATLLRTGRPVRWTREGDDLLVIPDLADLTPLDDVVRVAW